MQDEAGKLLLWIDIAILSFFIGLEVQVVRSLCVANAIDPKHSTKWKIDLFGTKPHLRMRRSN